MIILNNITGLSVLLYTQKIVNNCYLRRNHLVAKNDGGSLHDLECVQAVETPSATISPSVNRVSVIQTIFRFINIITSGDLLLTQRSFFRTHPLICLQTGRLVHVVSASVASVLCLMRRRLCLFFSIWYQSQSWVCFRHW